MGGGGGLEGYLCKGLVGSPPTTTSKARRGNKVRKLVLSYAQCTHYTLYTRGGGGSIMEYIGGGEPLHDWQRVCTSREENGRRVVLLHSN